MIFLIPMLGICDCSLEGRDSLSFFFVFVCGWWWFRLRDTLCFFYFFLLIMLEILFHNVLPWKPTLSPEKWLEDSFFSGALASLAEQKWSAYFPPLREPKHIEKASRLLGPCFFCWFDWELKRIQAIIPKKSILTKPRKARKKNHWEWQPPKKSHFDYINPENPRNKKKHVQQNTWVFS